MMKMVIPLLGLFIGIGVGVGAGIALTPTSALEAGPPEPEGALAPSYQEGTTAAVEIAMLNDQFVIPIVDEERVNALIVMSIGLEVSAGASETVFATEAKVRDLFLQVLFEHANMGGFDGAFTNARNLDLLRSALFKAASQQMGNDIKGILITDLARQDV